MAPGPVELDRPAWALTFEPCSILGIHQYPSASWASGLSSSSQCHVFRLVIVTILDVSQFIEFNSSVSCFIPDQLSSDHPHARILWLVLPATIVMSRHLQFGRVLEVTSPLRVPFIPSSPIANDLALKLDNNTSLGLGSLS
ncbi:hypothetical protein LB506_004317 [Fusarium annulatum]|nr:hypothetical protein LB506_004317 [Fusarium annulatum]